MEKTKICIVCGKEKSLDNFTKRKGTDRYREKCHECRRTEYKLNKETELERAKKYYSEHKQEIKEKAKSRRRNNLEKDMWNSAKRRAQNKGIPFSITIEDIVIPKKCPVLGIPLAVGDMTPSSNSPSLDRIIPQKGYVKGNIIVISNKANTIKNNATVEEIKKVAEFYEKMQREGVTNG